MEFSRQEYWRGLPFPPPSESSQPPVPCVSCTGKQILYHCTTWEAFSTQRSPNPHKFLCKHKCVHPHTHRHKIPFAQENSHSLSPPQHSPLTPTEPLKETGSGPQRYTTPETCPQSSCLRTSPSPPLLNLRATAILDHLLGVPPTN